MKLVNPYLNFDGNTKEAFKFYQSVFGGEFLDVLSFKEMGGDHMGVPENKLDSVAHIALPLGNDTIFMGDDGPYAMDQPLTMGNNFHISIEAESKEEAEQLFNDLSGDGEIKTPLEETEWAELFGMVTDKYSIQWMVNYPGNKA